MNIDLLADFYSELDISDVFSDGEPLFLGRFLSSLFFPVDLKSAGLVDGVFDPNNVLFVVKFDAIAINKVFKATNTSEVFNTLVWIFP